MKTRSRAMIHRIVPALLVGAAALSTAPLPAAAQDEPFRTRRVWKGSPEPFCCGNTMVTADGRYVPGWDDNGNLQYLDMLENRWIRVTDKGTWETSDSFSLNGMFSPDGEWIAHSWSEEGEPQLRVDRRGGSEHRVLFTGAAASPLDWSPDGRSVLVVARFVDPESVTGGNPRMGTHGWDRLLLLPMDGGEARVLKEVELTGGVDGRMALTPSSSGMLVAHFSPDGRWLAYQRFEEGSRLADIHLLSLVGATDRPLDTGIGNDRLMGWTADGSTLLFHSEREARPGIWKVSVSNGSPTGGPEFVRDDVWGMEPMGVGELGFYYGITSERPQVQTTEIDFESGQILSAPTPIRDPGSPNPSVSPAWSPDGRQLAYVVWTSEDGQSAEIAIRSLETGETRSFPIDNMGVGKVAWGSDPLNVLINGHHQEQGMGVFRLDLRSGGLLPVLVGDDAPDNLEDTFKRDGRTVAVPIAQEGVGIVAYQVRDLETGQETLIETNGYSWIMAFPGGGRYAVWTERGPRDGTPVDATLSIVGMDGSKRTIWQNAVQERFMQTMAITSDGKHILLGVDGKGLIVDTETGASRVLRTPTGEEYLSQGRAIVIQPNGSRVAFVGGDPVAEIWVMEGIR
jgi:Tol biopolymer transport system component